MVGFVGGMNDLASLLLEDCQEIECIFDTTSNFEVDAMIPKLVQLQLSVMENLKELCCGPPLQVLRFFEKLEKLYIYGCRHLHDIFPWECNLRNLKILEICNDNSRYYHSYTSGQVLFSTSVAQSLQLLEKLTIIGCQEMKHIIASGRDHGSNTGEEMVQAPTSSHFVMPRLKYVDIKECGKLKSIFEIRFVEGQIELPHLEALSLRMLENLIRVCPENSSVKWPSLKDLRVVDCPKLTTTCITMMVRSEQRHQNLNEQKHLSSTLQQLQLEGLPQFNIISWVGPTLGHILSFQCVRHLKVGYCHNLKFLFAMEVHRSLPELISLVIYHCQELEQIIAPNKEPVQLRDAEVYFPKLMDIRVVNCNKLKSLFPVAMVRMLPQLSTLDLSKCINLEEVFIQRSGDDNINKIEIVLSNLTKITLHYLQSFVDICLGCKLQAVKLQELHTDECPKIAQSLREIQYFTYMGMPAVEGLSDKMEALLSQNINTVDIQLLLASSKGDKSEIEHLLGKGAKYDVKDVDGRTALDRANDEIKEFILKHSKPMGRIQIR